MRRTWPGWRRSWRHWRRGTPSRTENIQEFLGAVDEFTKQTENATLEEYLENVALVTELDQAEQQVVRLMKGPDGAPIENEFASEE